MDHKLTVNNLRFICQSSEQVLITNSLWRIIFFGESFQCNQSVHIVQSIAVGREEPDLFDVSIKPFVSRLNFTTTQKSHIILTGYRF